MTKPCGAIPAEKEHKTRQLSDGIPLPPQPAEIMKNHLYLSLMPESLVASHLTPEEFGSFLFAEMGRWKAVLGNKKP